MLSRLDLECQPQSKSPAPILGNRTYWTSLRGKGETKVLKRSSIEPMFGAKIVTAGRTIAMRIILRPAFQRKLITLHCTPIHS